jgi:hypothetical protein
MKKYAFLCLVFCFYALPLWATAIIHVQCPPGIRIFLNDELKGVSSEAEQGLVITDVTPGEYTLRAVRDGFTPQETAISVNAGEVRAHQLRPFAHQVVVAQEGDATVDQLEQQVGTLIIQSLPLQCELAISGVDLAGNARMKTRDRWQSENIPSGTRVVTARAMNKTLTHEFEMVPGGKVHLFFNFINEQVEVRADERPDQTPTAVENTLLFEGTVESLSNRLQNNINEINDLKEKLEKVAAFLESPPEGAAMADIARNLELKASLESQIAQKQSAHKELEDQLNTLRKNRFLSDYEQYLKIIASDSLNDAVKKMAWQEICQKWDVDSDIVTTFGGLFWDLENNRPAVVTQLRLVAIVNGREVPATVRVGSRSERLPHVFELERDARFTAEVSYESGGVRYRPERVELTADWRGVRERRLTLEEVRRPVRGQNYSMDLAGGVTMEFVWISALNAWVGKYEVTNAEYSRFRPEHNNSGNLNDRRKPVVMVTYDDSVAFTQWLNAQEGLQGGGTRARLLTGDEWTAIARCGTNREYPWGNSMPPTRGHYHPSIRGYSSVGYGRVDVEQSGRNEWGLYGVGGNVGEWTSEQIGQRRAMRGGSWANTSPVNFRIEHRSTELPDFKNGNHGFRVVLSGGD